MVRNQGMPGWGGRPATGTTTLPLPPPPPGPAAAPGAGGVTRAGTCPGAGVVTPLPAWAPHTAARHSVIAAAAAGRPLIVSSWYGGPVATAGTKLRLRPWDGAAHRPR